MQVYLGSVYVNDFNKFGRTYQVIAQADAPFRATAENIAQLKVRNAAGEMVPLGSVLQVKQSYGPDQGLRYNGYPAADINGGPAPGVSSGQAERHHGAPRERDAAQRHRLSSGPSSPTSRSWPATPRSSSSRSACCWRSWCSRRSTRAGRCRSPSS